MGARAVTETRFDVGTHGTTSAVLLRAPEPSGATLIFAHGAGAPRTHPFIVALTQQIAARGTDVFVFNFLYAEAGRKMPDKTPLLEACWRAARDKANVSGPLFVGGKSMGGRMATHVLDERVRGVVCVGYPLHPIGKPKVKREEILAVDVPLLAVQGTKDELGTAAQLKRFVKTKSNIRVHTVRDGDHSLAVPKSSKRDSIAEAADAITAFIHEVMA